MDNTSGNKEEGHGSATSVLDFPEGILEKVFTLLPVRDFPNVALVCKKWSDILGNGNNEVWRWNYTRELGQGHFERRSELLAHLDSFKTKLRAFRSAWNPRDCSRNIYVKTNGFTIHRNPVAQSTDGVRGKRGFTQGRHAWDVIWEGPLGTVAVVGVATRGAEMRSQGYIALLGKDEHSWGWNLVENYIVHRGENRGHYPFVDNAAQYQVGDRIRVILDCEAATLAFEKDFEFMGVAFRGLPTQEPLYPAISTVYGNTEVSMVYLGPQVDV